MCEKHYIYGLVDPVSMSVRYIGRAINPSSRYNHHLREKGDSKKCKWVADLAKLGLKPTMVILEETNVEKVAAMESKWWGLGIGFGWDLVNTHGMTDDYDDKYKKSLNEYAEIYENRKHKIAGNENQSGARFYDPAYLFQKLRSNFFRPIIQDGNLVVLARGRSVDRAVIIIVEDHSGVPYFRSSEYGFTDYNKHKFSVPLSDLPWYAAAALIEGWDEYGGNQRIHQYVNTHIYLESPEVYEKGIAGMEAATPTTGRTFFAAL